MNTGYHVKYPSECFLQNNRSALQHLGFVAEAVSELLSNGCIVEHVVPPICASSLTVVVKKSCILLLILGMSTIV